MSLSHSENLTVAYQDIFDGLSPISKLQLLDLLRGRDDFADIENVGDLTIMLADDPSLVSIVLNTAKIYDFKEVESGLNALIDQQ